MLNFSCLLVWLLCGQWTTWEQELWPIHDIVMQGLSTELSWRHLDSYETNRSDIMVPILRMKKMMLNGNATRCSESNKSKEVLIKYNRFRRQTAWASTGCATFWVTLGILWNLLSQCLQLQNHSNKVPSLTTVPGTKWPIRTYEDAQQHH